MTERNGRFVLMVRAEHRGNVPGIVHGSSASGQTLFLEPAATVELNNDIVELEDREREEILRILTELTNRFRERAGDLDSTIEAATELDGLQAKARYSAHVNGIEPVFTADTSLELKGSRHPMIENAVRWTWCCPPNRVRDHRPEHGGKTVALNRGAVRVDGAGRASRSVEDGAAADLRRCSPTSATNTEAQLIRVPRTSRTW